MKLIDDWKRVLLEAWSVRWIVLANLLGAAPMLIDGLDGQVKPRTLAVLVLLANVAALISRFIKQPEKPGA